MMQAEDPHSSDFPIEYGDDDDPDEKHGVSYESLIAFLDREKEVMPDQFCGSTDGFNLSSDNADNQNIFCLQTGNQVLEPAEHGQWTSADYSLTSHNCQGTGLEGLFAKETYGDSCQPNTPETFHIDLYNVSDKNNFLKDESFDISQCCQQAPDITTNHVAQVDNDTEQTVEKGISALCDISSNSRIEYAASCSNYESSVSQGLHHANNFNVQDGFIVFGTEESNFLAPGSPFVSSNSASPSDPCFIISNAQAFGTKDKSGESCLTSTNSDLEAFGSLTGTADCWGPYLSNGVEETFFSKGRRICEPWNTGKLSAQISALPVKKEEISESSFQTSIIDINASSAHANCHHNVSHNAPSAESPSVSLSGGAESIINYQEFKNILQGTNSNIYRKDSWQDQDSISKVFKSDLLLSDPLISDDADICILEGISAPKVQSRVFHSIPRSFTKSDNNYPQEFSNWHKSDNQTLAFQIALQDLSEPKSETSLSNGALAVPLLRHQRIALSWMVQKERSGLNCLGGILADDQGLGKTVSMIALILSERWSSSKNQNQAAKQVEIETLNLDDDEEGVQFNCTTHNGNSDIRKMRKLTDSKKLIRPVKCRLSAGTLVVCPTSVLRQWAEELRNKVTSEGNLTFLVYHGSNRTKDPVELSNYDVVLTTYCIVSLEVPKQLDCEKDEEKLRSETNSELSSKKKRKAPIKSNSGNCSDENSTRPLARVAWFRVILDEAQTIKNHRTQVARACCGLRAKRRWCLSGTPIQNAVDDLYSYFKFLRYDPYAVYSSFCSTIKNPIHKNPIAGYKNLQAVLKTVMLRRTKGTLLDGKPIISLPPRLVALKKVDFSESERSFYQRLESESCEQFKVYAAAGTVKQNYVNILLMLLRLRQACDHPLLVQEYDSKPESPWKDSIRSATKLPWGKRIELLSHLEASMAICTICNDPPEDAVVSICGHVFCNQCICEHLTGDNGHCPASQCKSRLDAASVFPKSSLSCPLSAFHGDDAPSDSSMKPVTDLPNKDIISSDSSKIKAAIEILQSLPVLKSSQAINNLTGHDRECTIQCGEVANGHLAVVDDKVSQEKSAVITEKALVFSQWTRMLDLLEFRLKSSSILYRRLDGTMPVATRDKAVNEFNTIPEVTVMILSLKAASLGLNLIAACHVVLLDLWWNPTTEDQAIDRAHRIGQTRPVTVSRLTVNNTVEDRILLLQEKKRKMVSSAFGEDETGSRQSGLTVDDLKYLFMFN